ncbi:MAG: hypothetical protein HOP19_20130 [Acidobacteria bacterium]|nr:hypothetical protein [Acidobacteriota bacterium]
MEQFESAYQPLLSRTNNFPTNYPTLVNHSNSRITDAPWDYDAAGNLKKDANLNSYQYDAAGRNTRMERADFTQSADQVFDGDGQIAKRNTLTTTTELYLYATPLGGKMVSILHGSHPTSDIPLGSKGRGLVYANNVIIAEQTGYKTPAYQPTRRVEWQHYDPLTGNTGVSFPNGLYGPKIESDPVGVDVQPSDPFGGGPAPEPGVPTIAGAAGQQVTFTLDGFEIPGWSVQPLLDSSAAVAGPLQTTRNNNGRWEFYYAYADGNSGWLRAGGVYGSRPDNGVVIYGGDGGDRNNGFKHLLASELPDFIQDRTPVVLPTISQSRPRLVSRQFNLPPAPTCTSALIGTAPKGMRQDAATAIPLLISNSLLVGLNVFEIAYILGTAQHESGLGRLMTEIASGSAYEGRRDLGNVNKGDGVRFKGRGYAQITGRIHYTNFSNHLGIDMVANPNLATTPALAAYITVNGMREGAFTGRKLGDYINNRGIDFINARRIINSTDQATRIAGYANSYLDTLNSFICFDVAFPRR